MENGQTVFMCNTSNLEADELQQQKTTSVSAPVRREQDSDDALGTGQMTTGKTWSPGLDLIFI